MRIALLLAMAALLGLVMMTLIVILRRNDRRDKLRRHPRIHLTKVGDPD